MVKKLEPLVVEKIEELLFGGDLASRLFKSINQRIESSSSNSERDSIKAQIYGFNSQIGALTERLAELPKELSASSIFKQMKTLEDRKLELSDKIEKLTNSTQADYIAKFNEYDEFVQSLKKLWMTASSDMKSRIIKRLIHKVEVRVDSVVIHYNIDKRNMILETKKPSEKEGFFKNPNFFNLNGSNSLTNGARRGT